MGRYQVKNKLPNTAIGDDAVVCIDFGTAYCKAAVRIYKNYEERISPLRLGMIAGDPRSNLEFFCPSSLYVSTDRKVYFGHDAERKWSEEINSGISKIESMKRWLSVDRYDDFEDALIDNECLPTGVVLKKKYALIIMLAYLSRLVSSGLKRMEVDPFMKRRYSRPVLEEKRARWVDGIMRECLKSGQIVADSIGGYWALEGIPLNDLIDVVDEVSKLKIPDDFIEQRPVLEPVAAGFLAVANGGNDRDISIVIDVGAGTTDTAAFFSRPAFRRDESGAALPVGSPQSTPWAGDFLDSVLIGIIERQLGEDWSSNIKYQRESRGRVREWKETLFTSRAGVVKPTFVDGKVCSAIGKDQLVTDKRMHEFVHKIRSALDSLFPKKAIAETSDIEHVLKGIHAFDSINVVFAGGGSNLPILESIIMSPIIVDEKKLSLVRRAMVPAKVFDDSVQFEARYPQLAVAMGGASSEYPWSKEAKTYGLGSSKQNISESFT